MKSEIDRLVRLTSDVLDFEKLEAGKMVFHLNNNSIEEAIKQVSDSIEPLLKEKNLKCNIIIGEDIPEIKYDYDKIIQVMTNLISNAIKNTNEGSISIEAEKVKDHIRVSVTDTGIGIKEEDIEEIFKAFQRVEHDQKGKKGTGLGLIISKEIIEGHKGEIGVKSEYGKGSTFFFKLPIQKT